ncbi:MAG: NAD(P)-dependent oxidoreductase [Nitrospinota bacterium]|nr:NAD(P)-dependent oxidoreductase [Nitrospinota bacterium]
MESFVPEKTVIGIVGIGKMGTQMSKNLVNAGYSLYGFDVKRENVVMLVPDGVKIAESLAEIAKSSDVLITMLPSSDDVEFVILAEDGIAENLSKGKVIIDMSSSYPPRTKLLGDELQKRGFGFLGAPVSGGVIGAENATLAIMPGGPKELVDSCMPIFEVLGKKIVHAGESVDAGHAIKCVNNFLSATNLVASMEAMSLSKKLGLDPEKTLSVLNSGSGLNAATKDKWPRFLLPRDFNCGFSTGLMYKDLTMGSDLARESGATFFIMNHVRQVYGLGVAKFGANSDQTLLLKLIEEWAGIDEEKK